MAGFIDPGSTSPWGRPVDTAVDPQGRLFISDDFSGTIYQLTGPSAVLAAASPAAGAAVAQLYPNPAGPGPAVLDLTALPAGPYFVTVLDVLGRVVQPARPRRRRHPLGAGQPSRRHLFGAGAGRPVSTRC